MPQRTSGHRRLAALLVALAVAPFAFHAAGALDGDLWYDEIWSLRHYALQPVGKLLTDYSHPNNHVLFNLIQHVWLGLVGIDSVDAALDAPVLVRLPGLAAAVGCAIYVARTGRLLLGGYGGAVATALLVTALPFAHFATQARGYALSALWLAMLTFHAVRHVWRGTGRDPAWIVLSTGLAVYTIPSNAYAVAAVAAWLLTARAGRAALHVLLGALLATLAYAPMLPAMLENPALGSRGVFRSQTLTVLTPEVLHGFATGHVGLALAALVALVARRRAGAGRQRALRAAAPCATLALLPFVFSALRGDAPFLRVFSVLGPALALLLAAGCARLVRPLVVLGTPRVVRVLTALGIIALCHWGAPAARTAVRHDIAADLATGTWRQSLTHGYYSAHYAPRELAFRLARRRRDGAPVLVRGGDRVAVTAYLRHAGIEPTEARDERDLLRDHGRVWVISADPARELAEIRRRNPAVIAVIGEGDGRLHRAIVVLAPRVHR